MPLRSQTSLGDFPKSQCWRKRFISLSCYELVVNKKTKTTENIILNLPPSFINILLQNLKHLLCDHNKT